MSDSEDDDILPSAPKPLVLSWRNDRKETHSDWSICIRRIDERGDEVGREIYHVHKNIIAVGSRSSEYFARMFQTAMKEQNEASTDVELHPLQAVVMPNLLDYLYASSDEEADSVLELSTNTATALYSLGDYFSIVDLRKRAKAFYKNDVQLSNLKLYYTQARFLRTQKVMEHVQQVTAKTLLEVATAMVTIFNSSSNNRSTQQAEEDFGTFLSLAHVAELDFWVTVLEQIKAHWKEQGGKNEVDKDTRDSVSKCISVVVAAACAYCKQESLTMDMFSKLTDPAAVPMIDVHAAFPLLSMEKTLLDQLKAQEVIVVPDKEEVASIGDGTATEKGLSPLQQHFVQSLLSLSDDKEECSTSTGGGVGDINKMNNNNDSWELTSLQERCVDALALNWDTITYDDSCIQLLMSLDNQYLTSRIMVSALAHAKEQVKGSPSSKPRFLWPHRRSSSNSNKKVPPEKQTENKASFRPPWQLNKATATPSSPTASSLTSSPPARTPRLPQWLPNRVSQTQQPSSRGEKGKPKWWNANKNTTME